MMKHPRSYIATAIVMGVLLFSFSQFPSWASERPQYVRVIIHEHRLHFEESRCLDQHLKEHLYSRMVDQYLMDRGHSNYSVDAVATIDKIIIGVEHWGDPEKIESIAQSTVNGIKKRPPLKFIEQERVLVQYEDDLLKDSPSIGASVTSALLTATPLSLPSCSADQLRLAANNFSDWELGEYQVYKSIESGKYDLFSSSQVSMSNFPNPWDDLQFSSAENPSISTDSDPNILFVAYKGRAEPLLTTKLLAAIYSAIAGSQVKAKDVRPFGKAGFVIVGEYRNLVDIQKDLRATFNSSKISLAHLQYMQSAQKVICDLRAQKQERDVELFDEAISHTYFEYSAQIPFCERGLDFSRTAADMSIVTNLIGVAETEPDLPSYSDQMLLNLCIAEKTFVKADLSVAAYALRQHLRYDVGLALNIKYSRIEGNCVKGLVFAPNQNKAALERSFENFDPNSGAFVSRYLSAHKIYSCSKGELENCHDYSDFPKNATPKLYVYAVE